MNDDDRTTVGGLWFFSAFVLTALFVSAAAQDGLTRGHILLAVLILALDVAGTIWLMRQENENEQRKAKRQPVDSILSDLSDEELIELKRRLSDIDSREDHIFNHVGADGELTWRDQNTAE